MSRSELNIVVGGIHNSETQALGEAKVKIGAFVYGNYRDIIPALKKQKL